MTRSPRACAWRRAAAMTSATGVRDGDRDEPGALGVGGRPQADRQAVLVPLGREPVDLGDQADGADGDGPGRHRAAVGAAEPPGRRPDPLVVQERLAHPHEHDPGDPPPLRTGQVARLDPLVEDLPGREVAPGGHACRRAEDATHRAADLRREADADRPRLVQGDQHRLDRQAVVRPEAELLEPVDGRRHLAVRRQARQRPDRVAQEAGDLEGAPPGLRIVDAPPQEGRAEPADREPIRPQPKGVRHQGFGVQVAGVQHDSSLRSRSPGEPARGHACDLASSRECRMFPPINPCLACGPPVESS